MMSCDWTYLYFWHKIHFYAHQKDKAEKGIPSEGMALPVLFLLNLFDFHSAAEQGSDGLLFQHQMPRKPACVQ